MVTADQKRNGPLRIVVLGGGFAGVYAARYPARRTNSAHPVEVHIVNRENYMVYRPMLPEVISGSLGVADTVSPIRRLVPRAILHMREVESVDVEHNVVTCSPGFRPRLLVLEHDHLVVALGTVTDFRGMTGLAEHARPLKTLGDALALRNHVVHILEEADTETDAGIRSSFSPSSRYGTQRRSTPIDLNNGLLYNAILFFVKRPFMAIASAKR